MTIKISVTVRNALLDAFESTIGASALLKIFTGTAPANLADADSGTKLVDITLPADWMAAADAGSKSLAGTWEDASADGAGTAGYFRIYANGGTCHVQGSVTATGGGGDLTLNNAVIAAGQKVTITGFTLGAGNA